MEYNVEDKDFLVCLTSEVKPNTIEDVDKDMYCTCVLKNNFFYRGYVKEVTSHYIMFLDDMHSEMKIYKDKILVIYWTKYIKNKSKYVLNTKANIEKQLEDKKNG